MAIVLTKEQRQGPPLSDVAFAEWFVDEIMPEMHAVERRALKRVECLRKVKSARAYIQHFGFSVTSHQGQVMSLMWILGPNFFEFSPFREILADRATPPAVKVEKLWQVEDEAMQYAEDHCDDRYWYPRLVAGNILGLKPYSEMSEDELQQPVDERDDDPWSHFHDNDS
ncbi:hypothetical protein IV417_10505 [Alphaproteobacteria bacterium KMM 3653]|uniref:Uncharacterized protein n=1 Tax=Harenicola maris TaxID=2841044 RepID=A0AAP2G815_9RHOB|nr:hypothetical protein [Harenicola maris]